MVKNKKYHQHGGKAQNKIVQHRKGMPIHALQPFFFLKKRKQIL